MSSPIQILRALLAKVPTDPLWAAKYGKLFGDESEIETILVSSLRPELTEMEAAGTLFSVDA